MNGTASTTVFRLPDGRVVAIWDDSDARNVMKRLANEVHQGYPGGAKKTLDALRGVFVESEIDAVTVR